ncbi:phospholipid N-methyltransferase [Ereboglobus sp. PH5-5]|nr:phospholipid N-methyltransferase [Ereboglobus sp. PH5-5]
MGKRWKFFKESVRHFWQVGTLTHSSRYLVGSLLADVDFSEARLIVEFGPGSGYVTREILRRMRPDARLISFELNAVFYEEIKSIAETDPRLTAVHGSATLAATMLEPRSVDNIVSGLPMGNFGRRTKLAVLGTVQTILKPGGHFSQFQYSLLDYRLMKRHFETVRLGYTPLNFPPAFVYKCVSE